MKFIHMADVHLGAEPEAGRAYSEQRKQEIWDSFAAVLKICEKERIDFLLIAGDLFHRQPLIRELKEVNYLFSKLTVTKVIFIAGNHDYVKSEGYYKTFVWADNVYPLLDNKITCIGFPKENVGIYGLSYHQKEIRDNIYAGQYAPGQFPYEILLAHGGDETHAPFKKNELMDLGYNYIALGHIHKPQILVENFAAYAGALEPVDRNDVGRHGFIKGEMTPKGTVTRFVPFAKREYIHMEIVIDKDTTNMGLREQIREKIEAHGVQNLYKLRLVGNRDPEIIFEKTGMDSYGNILQIVDATSPAYDFQKLEEKNQKNLLGKYIACMKGAKEGTREYQALYEGVQALLETKRGF